MLGSSPRAGSINPDHGWLPYGDQRQLDANSLRRQVGKHAAAINKMAEGAFEHQILRERMGHTRVEIGAGIVVGFAVASAVNMAGLV